MLYLVEVKSVLYIVKCVFVLSELCLKGLYCLSRIRVYPQTLEAQSTRPPVAGIPTLPIEFGDVITPFVRLYKYTVYHSTTVCMCVNTLVCHFK